MKKLATPLTFLLVLFAIFWSFKSSMPAYHADGDLPKTSFSTDRALAHVKEISKKPHAVGFPGHKQVRDYIVGELEKMGLKTTLQMGYTAGDWGNLSKPTNILARIKGSGSGKALLLLAHYDSNPHSSLGASDDGSGVATILEGVRTFLSKKRIPKNDIIVLISDAEELGLNGADLFVNDHPWAKSVGLALNFEARGSGGPSYMLIETNGGNAHLIRDFTAADPQYPVANSLVYSIYKMLPNDTDLTVFRKDGDIEGFNFAFIDDHFDYHTARDNYDRLDRSSLAHQGSYLMPLLNYFSDADLENLKSTADDAYFNFPYYGLVSYPFAWIWTMFGLVVVVFIILLIIGFRNGQLNLNGIAKGFVPMFLALAINGAVGYYSWPVLNKMYPQYTDILQGFTYNGYTYILAFVLFSIGICFWTYHRFRKTGLTNLLVAPLLFWLVLCGGVSAYLPGASFFLVPVVTALISFMILIKQKSPSPYLLMFLTLPALLIYAPLIKMFPVGLGLKMMVSATILTTLTFFLMLPLFGFYKHKNRFAMLGMVLFVGFMVSAHLDSGFSKENAKPSSLLYVLNIDNQEAHWVTYDHYLNDWTAQYLGADKQVPQKEDFRTLSSKYATHFSYTANAPLKDIPGSKVEKLLDTLINEERILKIKITPRRSLNRLDVFVNDIDIKSASVNDISLTKDYLENRKNHKLITHYISDNDPTSLLLIVPKDSPLTLDLYEASNDLLKNSLFSVPERPINSIPMPFVLNDAIVTTQTVTF
ncbi:M28 family peptidase [Flavobacteriaceae bacterium F89]|uniref:Vacuolar membrane protease n=1 Tax=Cerina litoralis TaxID=2874477 RepID=A0AAE3EVA8_9FLAO|nr:M28 family peptidase [Cerina litoralis]MCG2460854.1 M28 family peptidase [Cerina litoralis]